MGFVDYISREPQQDAAKISNYDEQFFIYIECKKCG